MNPPDNADLIAERDGLIERIHYTDAYLLILTERLDEINQTLNPEAYVPQNADYPRYGET